MTQVCLRQRQDPFPGLLGPPNVHDGADVALLLDGEPAAQVEGVAGPLPPLTTGGVPDSGQYLLGLALQGLTAAWYSRACD